MRISKILVFILALLGNTSVLAASYFVKPNGSDNNDGRSHSAAWKSIAKVNSYSFSPGDDVYFLSGGVWNAMLTIDWSGISKDQPTIVAAYYMKNGEEVIGVLGTPPTIEGSFAGIDDISKLDTSSGIPSSRYDGLIRIGTKGVPQTYVTVQNFQLLNSAGRGVVSWSFKSNYNVIKNNVIRHTASSGIAVRGSYTVIYKNDVSQASPLTLYSKDEPDGQPCIYSNGAKNIIEGNFVHECWYEGIGSYKNKGFNIIRGNLVVAAKRLGIYFSNSENNIAEHNKIIGDRTTHTIGNPPVSVKYTYPSGWPGTGLQATSEEWGPVSSDNNYFRNNLVANHSRCIYASVNTAGKAAGYTAEGKFYGNTCVGNKNNVGRASSQSPNSSIVAMNNIFIYGLSDGSASDCRWNSSSSTFGNNYWHEKPPNSACWGDGDIYSKLELRKNSGWGDVGLRNIPEDEDFLPNNGIVSERGLLLSSAVFNASNFAVQELQAGCAFDSAQMLLDYACETRGSKFDIGAFRSRLPTDSIVPPTNPRLRIK